MKRKNTPDEEPVATAHPRKHSKTDDKGTSRLQVQIVVGTYDKVLHGAIATFSDPHEAEGRSGDESVAFHDNFKFVAHRSAIRCLAISPLPAASQKGGSEARRIFLASGGTDGCVNVYQIDGSSRAEPRPSANASLANGKDSPAAIAPRNEEVGSLGHHSAYITSLDFASRSKLLSAADDSTIAVSRTRDWTVLSTLKAPIPRAVGRPSGDTAPDGTAPSGINDFSVHPSKKLMISVGKGERCMRLWNLVTGKKAGVLAFDRLLLHAVGERRGSRGEGSYVEWNSSGDEFVVVFERGAAVFSMDCKPKGVLLPSPPTKVHRMRYLPGTGAQADILVAGTEDGRLIFTSSAGALEDPSQEAEPPVMQVIGDVGGKQHSITGRVKDFDIVRCSTRDGATTLLVITASSDGTLRLWDIALTPQSENGQPQEAATFTPMNVTGSILGTYATENRITCLKAFLMSPNSVADNTDKTAPKKGPLARSKSASNTAKGDSEEEFEGLGSDAG